MKRVLLALFIYAAMAAPAAAYAPSQKLRYTQLETSFMMMMLGCQKQLDVWQQFACLAYVDKLRHTKREYLLPAQAQELLEAGRRMFGR